VRILQPLEHDTPREHLHYSRAPQIYNRVCSSRLLSEFRSRKSMKSSKDLGDNYVPFVADTGATRWTADLPALRQQGV